MTIEELKQQCEEIEDRIRNTGNRELVKVDALVLVSRSILALAEQVQDVRRPAYMRHGGPG